MADNKPGSASSATPTLAEYKKSQTRVRELIDRRRAQERKLVRLAPRGLRRVADMLTSSQAQLEESIASKESAYLDSTPTGNIITGFDNYMKGTSGAAAQRRRAGPMEQNRVFSRSSVSYRPNNGVGACDPNRNRQNVTRLTVDY